MRPTVYPTFVNLKDLADEGESFVFSRQTAELNSKLKDVVAQHDYQVALTITSMGNAFEITGKIDTEMDVVCARCGRDMVHPIHDNFSELIVVMDERPRAGHSGHTGMQLDEGPYCNYSTTYQFDLGEFVHEHIAA